jgi:hypothetical protein
MNSKNILLGKKQNLDKLLMKKVWMKSLLTMKKWKKKKR